MPHQFSLSMVEGEIRASGVVRTPEWMLPSNYMVSRNFAATIRSGFAALLFFSIPALAVAPAPGISRSYRAKEREATAEKFVSDTLRIWQGRLNLKDWNIQVHLVRPSALEPKTLGNIHWDMNTRDATIGVLSAYDYTLPLPEMLDDMEFTIVHELVHLQLASLPRNDASRGNEEHAVNQISRALLNLAKGQ